MMAPFWRGVYRQVKSTLREHTNRRGCQQLDVLVLGYLRDIVAVFLCYDRSLYSLRRVRAGSGRKLPRMDGLGLEVLHRGRQAGRCATSAHAGSLCAQV
jgi:hypothetical protein